MRIQLRLLCTYLPVAILKKTLKLEPRLHDILQVPSVTLSGYGPVPELFANYTRVVRAGYAH